MKFSYKILVIGFIKGRSYSMKISKIYSFYKNSIWIVSELYKLPNGKLIKTYDFFSYLLIEMFLLFRMHIILK